jgi:hypothetical protein
LEPSVHREKKDKEEYGRRKSEQKVRHRGKEEPEGHKKSRVRAVRENAVTELPYAVRDQHGSVDQSGHTPRDIQFLSKHGHRKRDVPPAQIEHRVANEAGVKRPQPPVPIHLVDLLRIGDWLRVRSRLQLLDHGAQHRTPRPPD